MAINIPKEDLLILKRIADLDEQQFDSLRSVFRDVKPTVRKNQFLEAVGKKVNTIQPQELKAIMGVAFTLYTLKDRQGLNSKQVADLVSESAVAARSKDAQLPSDKREILNARLKSLLEFDKSIGVTAKAFDILTEHERIFCKARVLSDVRPVFGDTPDSASAAVIVHNLQIGFHRNGRHEEIYIAMDTEDIRSLKELLVRAEKKTEALKAILNKASVDYLPV